MAKFTWTMAMDDFKEKHPKLSKYVAYWCPVDRSKIEIWFEDGSKGVYDCENHKLVYIQDRWK